jgi:hypothetical protein
LTIPTPLSLVHELKVRGLQEKRFSGGLHHLHLDLETKKWKYNKISASQHEPQANKKNENDASSFSKRKMMHLPSFSDRPGAEGKKNTLKRKRRKRFYVDLVRQIFRL